MVVVCSYGCLVATCLNNEGTPIDRGQIASEVIFLRQALLLSIRCIYLVLNFLRLHQRAISKV